MSSLVSKAAAAVRICGSAEPGFARLRAAFEENFERRGEIGAALCVYQADRKVVDLWGGYRDAACSQPWVRDTLVCMMSCTKAVAALAVLMLVDRNRIDLDSPVARYWPAFAQSGKEDITVKQLLGGFAGLIYPDLAPPGALTDWSRMIEALERQRPHWPPGTQGAYHSSTMGFLLGELLRRVDGRPIEQFVREEIAGPLGVEFHLVLEDTHSPRVAALLPNEGSATLQAIADPSTPLGRAWLAKPATSEFLFSAREFRRAVNPSANGHSNARSLARIYAALACGGEIDGVRLISPALIEQARTTQWRGPCGLTGREYHSGLGFFLNHPPLTAYGPNPRAFGHPGAGGALGFADPEAGLAFSYSPNFMCSGAGLGERCEELIRALYE